ncbi:hypothetical protein JHK86_037501 [Glycine max]|nr:hypothetical protein JHK86_037501 [Glycine max]
MRWWMKNLCYLVGMKEDRVNSRNLSSGASIKALYLLKQSDENAVLRKLPLLLS